MNNMVSSIIVKSGTWVSQSSMRHENIIEILKVELGNIRTSVCSTSIIQQLSPSVSEYPCSPQKGTVIIIGEFKSYNTQLGYKRTIQDEELGWTKPSKHNKLAKKRPHHLTAVLTLTQTLLLFAITYSISAQGRSKAERRAI